MDSIVVRFRNRLCLATAVFVLLLAITIDTRGETFTSPDSAGAEFSLLGEYTGEIESWGGAWAAQVVALGNSQFDVLLLPGGLPGDGYRSEDAFKKVTVKSEDAKASGTGEAFLVLIRDEKVVVLDDKGKPLGELTKVLRQSPTLEAAAPENSKVLFDGNSVDGFKGGRLIDGKYLGVGCESEETFGDHILHIEFRTPFMPNDRGQGRGNSGVYIQGRYELQVLDSFGLPTADNECGGIYQIAKPKLNMCFPPLSWQTYDIEFQTAKYDTKGNKTSNAVVTIKHNGVVIHEALELPHHTPGKNSEAASPGPLFLQDHGNPVTYRNIWAVKQ